MHQYLRKMRGKRSATAVAALNSVRYKFRQLRTVSLADLQYSGYHIAPSVLHRRLAVAALQQNAVHIETDCFFTDLPFLGKGGSVAEWLARWTQAQ